MCPSKNGAVRHEKTQMLWHLGLLVPRAGLEPARPFRAKGFSYHYSFRYRHNVCGLDYSFTMGPYPLGVSCLVSAPSFFLRLGSRLPAGLPGRVSLNLRHSTSLFSESALNDLSPSCLPFHHQGGRGRDGPLGIKRGGTDPPLSISALRTIICCRRTCC